MNVISSLHQTGKYGEATDGMDISLICLDKKAGTIEYSGAMNPVYIVRNKELLEYKADKIPIGIYEFLNQPFQKEIIEFKEGDTFYLFTDGYADQFGGKEGEKLKYNRFKKLLINISSSPVNEQEVLLDKYLMEWKGENEHVDDILILGFRII